MLSFGEEAEDEEKELALAKQKIKSSHDVLNDPRLLKEETPNNDLVICPSFGFLSDSKTELLFDTFQLHMHILIAVFIELFVYNLWKLILAYSSQRPCHSDNPTLKVHVLMKT